MKRTIVGIIVGVLCCVTVVSIGLLVMNKGKIDTAQVEIGRLREQVTGYMERERKQVEEEGRLHDELARQQQVIEGLGKTLAGHTAGKDELVKSWQSLQKHYRLGAELGQLFVSSAGMKDEEAAFMMIKLGMMVDEVNDKEISQKWAVLFDPRKSKGDRAENALLGMITRINELIQGDVNTVGKIVTGFEEKKEG